MAESPVRVVKVALISNCVGTVFKLITGLLTGSAALISEAIHSLVGAINQALVCSYGNSGDLSGGHIYSYGHGQGRYLVNLWASVGLFSIGSGIGMAWGVYRLTVAAQVSSSVAETGVVDWMSLLAVLGAVMIQGYSFFLALRLYLIQMRQDQSTNPFRYLRDCKDISLAVIVTQSVAGMGGLLLAAIGVSATLVTQNPLWDALAAFLIAILMGWTAFSQGTLYMRHLTDVRDLGAEQALQQLLTHRRSVHRCIQIHSVITEDHSTLLFAEIELTQEAMVAGMLKSVSMQKQTLLRKLPEDKHNDVKAMAFVTARSMVEAPLKRAGKIVADLEQSLREQLPQVAAVSIRIRGISPFQLPTPGEYKSPPNREAEYIGADSSDPH